ncbi:MAG: cobalamin-dependent protein [Proteobacteria bacterium]|nr:cobalamin-dependent protein [Pseudomonadota bacterium]
MNPHIPHILFVNPWIHDFAAYDVWAKPYGLLSLAAITRCHGYQVSYIDCLDRFHPRAGKTDPYIRNGRGPFRKKTIQKPGGLSDINRTYSRYGIEPEWFREDLSAIPKPDLIMVTSLMTYWAPGVRETISAIKKIFPTVPVFLGGIYASLCYDHACKHSGADRVLSGSTEKTILDIFETYFGYRELSLYNPDDPDTYPYPAFDLQRVINYVPILSSRGCPFSCAYCASGYLNDAFTQRKPEFVVEEIKYFNTRHGVRDFAFYDDALLVNAKSHAIPMLEQLVNDDVNVRFHLPNALHIREINEEIASLMYLAGFQTIRLGLETVEFQEKRHQLDRKVSEKEFYDAVNVLLSAGFEKDQVGAYLLCGLPDQTTASVESSIRTVLKSGITPVLSHYTPIPHTALWPKAVLSSRYDLEADPIYTNNAILPCQKEPFSWEKVLYLKNIIKEGSDNNKPAIPEMVEAGCASEKLGSTHN